MSKNNLIMLINKLNEESSIEEFKEILLYDFKNESPNESVRIEDDPIKKFLRYKIDYKSSKFDCDTSDLACEVIEESFDVKLDYSDKRKNRGYNPNKNNEIKLESDTMNSFSTTFNEFMKNHLKNIDPDWKVKYKEKYKYNNKLESHRSLWFLENIDRYFEEKVLQEWGIQECYKEFKTFASLTHSIGNLILVPNKFNVERARHTADYWDLSLELLKNLEEEKCEDINYKWYCNNINKFFLDDYFHNYNKNKTLREMYNNLLFKNHSFTHKKPRSIEEFNECLRNINARIIRRGIRLIKNINSKLDNEMLGNVYSQILFRQTI